MKTALSFRFDCQEYPPMPPFPLRHDWTTEEAESMMAQPFADLLFQAQTVHRQHWNPNQVQKSQLLSIKTGGCAENCGYCSQSASFKTGLQAEKLMQVDAVVTAAREAQAGGAERFCMGAAWRNPKPRDMEALCGMVREVKSLGLETCMTLGMLTSDQSTQLAAAGLDYYNHNLDSAPDYYSEVVTTRTYDDRLDTLEHVRQAGMNVCSGGIVGMGESRRQRAGLLVSLATLPEHPGSVPINALVPIRGTPLGDKLLDGTAEKIDGFEFVRTIAAARIMMPKSVVRLSAGRESMSDELQALCFLAGANSVFLGEKLLTTPNAGTPHDEALFEQLGLTGFAVETSVAAMAAE
jgi:biotin synthase